MKTIILEEQLLIKVFLNLVIYKKLYLVKMCPIFDSSPPVFGARYQSFLRVCWFLHKGVPYFGYPSKNLSNPTDINLDTFAGPYYRGENPRESYLCPHPKIRRFSGISPPKIPEIVIVPVPKVSPKLLESLSPSPSPNFGVFRGFSPENPRCADCPHPRPRNIGEIVKISGIPRKSPKELE